jgi:hypothetical protein
LIDYYLNSVDGDLCKELSPKEIMFKSVHLKGHVMIKIGEHSWNGLILDNFIVKCSVRLLLKCPANSITFILRTTARSTMCEHYIQMNDRLASRENDFCSANRKVCGELGKDKTFNVYIL